MIGERVFKTSYRTGEDFMKHEANVQKMHKELSKLKQVQKKKRIEKDRHRLGFIIDDNEIFSEL